MNLLHLSSWISFDDSMHACFMILLCGVWFKLLRRDFVWLMQVLLSIVEMPAIWVF